MSPTFLVSGATGAIGGEAAVSLGSRGAHVILLCRDLERGQDAGERVRDSGGTAELLQADLSRPSSIRSAVASFLEGDRPLNGLVNSAAVFKRARSMTPDGLELMFAINHQGPFLLTNLLLPRLEASSPARVVTVTAPSTSTVNFADLQQGNGRFSALRAFGATKAENLLFTFALAKRLKGGVTANALHPGLVRSGLTREMPMLMRAPIRVLSRDPRRAGQAIADLVSGRAHAEASGTFFKLSTQAAPPRGSLDVTKQDQLWEASMELAQLGAN